VHPRPLLFPAILIVCGCSGFPSSHPKTTGRDHPTASADPSRPASAIEDNRVDEDDPGDHRPLARRSSPPQRERRPGSRQDLNLVLVTIDTLRIDLGFMGYPRPVSPNLDALAARSTVFERAYSMASYTGKSLGPMMIGKYASECWRDGAHFDTYAPENTLLAERLQTAGFRTMGVASHWYFKPKYGLAQGMDVWDLSTVEGGPATSRVTSEALSNVAIGLLSDPGNVQGRFFLWIHYFDPHQIYVPHPEAPDFGPGTKNPAKRLYDGEVWYTDHHLGRLLDFIASQPWAERTAIVVTSDHGEAFDEHRMNGHGVDLWESLVRVPLVVYVPGTEPHRVRVKRSLVDLVPTVLDLMGLPQPPAGELSGESTAAAIVTTNQAAMDERDIYLDIPAGPQVRQHRAIIHGTTPGMKLMHEGGPVYFLFDLSKDERETSDLAGNRKTFLPMFAAFNDKLASLRQVRVISTTAADWRSWPAR
jgi:choline-sulfatase